MSERVFYLARASMLFWFVCFKFWNLIWISRNSIFMFYHLCSLLQDFVLFCFWSSAAAILLTFIFYFEAAYNTGLGYDWVILAFTYSLPSEIGSHMLLPGHVLCLPHQWWFNMIYSIPPSSSCQSSYRKLPKLAYAAPDVPNKGLLSFLLKLCNKLERIMLLLVLPRSAF